MKLRRHRKALVTVVVVLGTTATDASGIALGADPFEIISDLDLSFLIGNPKTPWGPDLFRRKPGFATVENNEERPKLHGIVYEGNQSVAFVGNKTVGLGDHVGPRRVVEIGPNYVVLEVGDSQIELVLPPAKKEQP